MFRGAYHDFTQYPEAGCTDPHALTSGAVTCLTDAQLRAQLQSFISAHGLPKGMGTVYDIITPPGVTLCLEGGAATHCSDYAVSGSEELAGERKSTTYKNSFCSYHGDINPDSATEGDANTILYAAIPWSVGELGLSGFTTSLFYSQGFPCQDGGWNPAEHKEVHEAPAEPSEAEKEVLEGKKGTHEEKLALEKKRRLEGPHQEEPNQVGKDPYGDYSAGLYDLVANQIAVEQANVVTDPMLNGWQDNEKHEVTDECRNVFAATVSKLGEEGIQGSATANSETEAGTLSNTTFGEEAESGRYYINNVYSLASHRCVGGAALKPSFTAPTAVNNGEVVGFDGMESDVGLMEGLAFGPSGPPTKTYATFSWSFGDGTSATGYAPGSPVCEAPWLSPCAGAVYHAYAYGGTYTVTLTVTDIAGNTSAVTRDVVVHGPAAASAAAGAPAGSSSTSGGGKAGVVAPAARAVVASRSLRSALRNGLAVSYSVNQRVAGHFEVLISRALANKLHIAGTPASGLPAGTPPELVIAKAILVTTKAGGSVVHIKFPPKVAARLKHAKSAPLMLRLIVRDGSDESATAVSTVTLRG